MTLKRFCDTCNEELVYNRYRLDIVSKPNSSDLDLGWDLCHSCAHRVNIAIKIAINNLQVKDIESIK